MPKPPYRPGRASGYAVRRALGSDSGGKAPPLSWPTASPPIEPPMPEPRAEAVQVRALLLPPRPERERESVTDQHVEHRYLAAQLWCEPQHSHKEMDGDLAESIATLLDKQLADARAQAVEECARAVEFAMVRNRWTSAIEETWNQSCRTHAARLRALLPPRPRPRET